MRRKLTKRTRRTTSGLTLLELVVAIFVLSLGSVAALRGVDQSRRGIGEDSHRLMARIVAENRAEALRLLGAGANGLPAQVQMGPHVFTVTTSRKSTAGGLLQFEISVRGKDGPGAFLVTYLPAPGAGG